MRELRACAHKSAFRAPPSAAFCRWAAEARDVLPDAVLRALFRKWAVRGGLESGVQGGPERQAAVEIWIADHRALQEQAEGAREDSREPLAEAGSNSVSEELWEEQPDEQRAPAWHRPAPEKSRAAVRHADSIPQEPGALQVSPARLEQPADAQQV